VIYLTPEQVLFLHDRLIEESGGEHGVRDVGLLESALARSPAGSTGPTFYPEATLQAAALLNGMTRNQPFVDGNKRIGIATAALFLEANGYQLTAGNLELEGFTLHVTTGEPFLSEIAAWFQTHTKRVRPRS
jgi:death-on-curing protein